MLTCWHRYQTFLLLWIRKPHRIRSTTSNTHRKEIIYYLWIDVLLLLEAAADCSNWRHVARTGARRAGARREDQCHDKRERQRARVASAPSLPTPHTYSNCDKDCLSRIGLKSHSRRCSPANWNFRRSTLGTLRTRTRRSLKTPKPRRARGENVVTSAGKTKLRMRTRRQRQSCANPLNSAKHIFVL